MTKDQRASKAAEISQTATAIINSQKTARIAKTARLRDLRLAKEAAEVAERKMNADLHRSIKPDGRR